MGFFGKIAQLGIDVVSTPIDIIKDAATLGGVLTDNDETYTGKKLRKIANKSKEVYNSLDED